MQIVAVLLIAALTFGICFLVDKGFAKLFRSQAQHKSGKAVRLNKRYGSAGIILVLLGVVAIFASAKGGLILLVGGALVILMGIGLAVYYLSYGIFYDEETFLFMTFGKKEVVYFYKDIQCQQLYNNQGYILLELHMADGKAIHLQSTMNGCYPFMDHAFAAWLRQTGRKEEDCPFYDPSNSCWFPPVEG